MAFDCRISSGGIIPAMHAQVREYVSDHGLLDGAGPVLLGVSGGIDSMALLHCLHALDFPILCAHFNHRLRPAAERDRDLVRSAAAELGVPFIEGEGDVQALHRETGLGLEAAARRLRYRFLFRQAALHRARAVVTAHTADDRIETVLMNLLRGTGLRGLRGILPRTVLPEFDPAIPLDRPLLGAWRSSIAAYQAEAGFAFVVDETNADVEYFRNRVRHEILPALAGHAPLVRSNLLRLAQAAAEDEGFIEQAAAAAREAASIGGSDNWIGWDAAVVTALPAAILVRLLQAGLSALKAGADELDFEAVRRAVRLIASGATTGECDLTGGYRLIREYDRFWLARSAADLPAEAWPQVASSEVLVETLPARIRLSGDWVLTAERAGTAGEGGGFSTVLDEDRLRFPLAVRGRLAGERFAPDGMDGRSKRLSDAMIDWKIPRRLRARWPLLVSAGQVVWVPGHRVGESYSAGPETRRPVALRLFRG